MTIQVITDLNSAQSLIYSRSNIARAYEGFDDTDIAGIGLTDDHCIVMRRDGTEQAYDKQLIKDSFISFSSRLKDFFAYLGPNYRGPSVWHNNCYVMFKGWHYTHSLAHASYNAMLQRQWADKFIHITNANKLISLLQSPETDIGHLVAPDGITRQDDTIDLDATNEQEEKDPAPIQLQSYCSCGSFTRQLENLSDFAAEIQGFEPTCIHMTWFHKYRNFLCKRTEVRESFRNHTPDKCVAWWYAPPSDHYSDGRFVLLYTKSGVQAPATHWRAYKSQEVFTQKDAWSLFDNMMDAGFVPYPGTALPQLSSLIKKKH